MKDVLNKVKDVSLVFAAAVGVLSIVITVARAIKMRKQSRLPCDGERSEKAEQDASED